MIRIFLGSPPPHIEAWIKANFKAPEKWVPAAYTNEWVFSDGNNYKLAYTKYSQEQLNEFQQSGMPELTCEVNLESLSESQVQLNNFSILEYEHRGSVKWNNSSGGTTCTSTVPFDLAYENGIYIADTIIKVEFSQSTYNYDTLSWSDPITVSGYQVYTPGHWEDANGNWINGSWGKWNNEEYSSVSWLSYDDAKTQHESGWYPEVNDISKLFGWQYGSASLNNLNVKDAQNVNANLLYLISPDLGLEVLQRRIWTNTVPEPNA